MFGGVQLARLTAPETYLVLAAVAGQLYRSDVGCVFDHYASPHNAARHQPSFLQLLGYKV
jgi:hypothetical protein